MGRVLFRYSLEEWEEGFNYNLSSLDIEELRYHYFFGDVLIHDYETGATFFSDARVFDFILQIENALDLMIQEKPVDTIYEMEQLYEIDLEREDKYLIVEDIFQRRRFRFDSFVKEFYAFKKAFLSRVSVLYPSLNKNLAFQDYFK